MNNLNQIKLNAKCGLLTRLLISRYLSSSSVYRNATESKSTLSLSPVTIADKSYPTDCWFNIPPKILQLIGRNLHNQKNHPLWIVKQRVAEFFYTRPSHARVNGSFSSPLFSVHDSFNPVVTTSKNFDDLLVLPNHVSRRRTDSYFINEKTMLRSHLTTHEMEMISLGLDAFLIIGDVYRRDDIDALHYPAFHQLECVRLFSQDNLFKNATDPSGCLSLFEPGSLDFLNRKSPSFDLSSIPQSSELPPDRQPCHTIETARCMEYEFKSVMEELVKSLLGNDIPMRWVPAYFPFTHPSWELEIQTGIKSGSSGGDGWTEMLGSGILRQEILSKNGVFNKVGYAAGLGLERWAMQLFGIPDIRLFWSNDSGFLSQFKSENSNKPIKYKPVSVYPACYLDVSFWLPGIDEDNTSIASLEIERSFCEIIRTVAGDLVEQVTLIDEFVDKSTSKRSQCYRIVYRDHHRTLTLAEIRPIHEEISRMANSLLNVTIR